MMFKRFQNLGEEKFRRITEELMRGTPVIRLARLIQGEWEDCIDVEERKLARELKRLHTAVANELFRRSQERAQQNSSVQTTRLESSGHDGLDQLMKLESIVKQRIGLWEKREREGSMLPELTTMMQHHVKLVVAIQKLRFDLGIDEYKLRTPAVKEDGDSKWQREQELNNQIYEADKKVKELLKNIKLPKSVDASDTTLATIITRDEAALQFAACVEVV